jgi:ABC-type transport system involved in cytochrome c biogenesis permease subunit
VTETLDSYSLVAIYSAMAVYTIAFIMFTLDLARRSAAVPTVAAAVSQGAAYGGTAVMEKTDAPARDKGPRYLRAAMALAVLAWVLHIGGVILRGLAAERVPWANMFEFSITGTAIIVGVFLAAQFWQDLRFLGAFITGFALIALGVATVNFYVDVVPLPPALQSTWLVIHVFVATLGTGFFALGAGLSIVQLLQARREANKTGLKFLGTLPGSDKLETIWAERAWGRYWGWDTKEVWTFIIWVIFAGYIHARATKGWRGGRSAWLAIIGFAAVLFNFTIVNLFFKGLHAYSGL